MAGKILALMEDSIGPKLLLASRLEAAGYAVTVLSNPGGFGKRIDAEAFDWLVLEEEAARRDGGRLLRRLTRRPTPARIVWLGRRPRRAPVPIEAVFGEPLDYDAIARFFSGRALSGGSSSPARGVTGAPRATGRNTRRVGA